MNLQSSLSIRLLRLITFSNLFYGVCALFLANGFVYRFLHHFVSIPLNCFIFLGTLIYYTYAYLPKGKSHKKIAKNLVNDARHIWYVRYQVPIRIIFYVLILTWLFNAIVILIYTDFTKIIADGRIWFWLTIGIVLGLLYYGTGWLWSKNGFSLRKIYYLKPIIISAVWVLSCQLLPLIWMSDVLKMEYDLPLVGLEVIYSFLLIVILCIIFDIKDDTTDQLLHTETTVTRFGIAFVLQKIIYPIMILCLILRIAVAMKIEQTFYSYLITLLPLIIITQYILSVKKPKKLYYFLFFIDGCMLLKGLGDFLIKYLIN